MDVNGLLLYDKQTSECINCIDVGETFMAEQ